MLRPPPKIYLLRSLRHPQAAPDILMPFVSQRLSETLSEPLSQSLSADSLRISQTSPGILRLPQASLRPS